MAATTPGLLSVDILDRTDLRRALEEHDFQAAFALMKKYGGLSQNRIAAACNLTPGKVSNVVGGTAQITTFEVIVRIADGLRIPGHLLGLAPRPWESRLLSDASSTEKPTGDTDTNAGTEVDEQGPWRPDATVRLADDLTRSDLVIDRRAATRALTGAAVTGATLLDSLEGWLQEPAADARTARRPGRLSTQQVEQLEATARAFRSWSHKYGGGLSRKAVVAQLGEVACALDDHQRPDIERRLYRAMAQLSGTAATMAWDCGMQRKAQDYYRLALRAAHAGNDTLFGANVLAGMARQMLCTDRPHDALELVRFAQDGARHEAGPRVRAMLHTREAWALAAMGRTTAFHRATAQAAEVLADSGDVEEPYWIAYFDHSELAGVTGGRLLDLARENPKKHARQAATHIRQAIQNRGLEAGRSHALDRIGLAECHFLVGDVTEAVAETTHAVAAARRTRSSRVRTQLGRLYPYTVGHDASKAVREARDSIRDLLI